MTNQNTHTGRLQDVPCPGTPQIQHTAAMNLYKRQKTLHNSAEPNLNNRGNADL
jgi:hypothetical protein